MPSLRFSKIIIVVERNLGFEVRTRRYSMHWFFLLYILVTTVISFSCQAEHIRRAAAALEKVEFYYDAKARRTGVLTTEKVKLASMTLLNIMLRERRMHILPESKLISLDARGQRKRLREQMEIYSMQFKVPDTVFQKGMHCPSIRFGNHIARLTCLCAVVTGRYALSGKVGGMKDDVVICLQLGVYWTETGHMVLDSDELAG